MHKTQQEVVYSSLKEAILRGKFEPGKSVTLRGVAQTLDVSLMPVRESLRRLTAEGALELLENRRIAVPKMTQTKLSEIYFARTTLETYAAEAALDAIDEQGIAKLEAINQAHNQAIKDENVEDYIFLNFEFHRTLYAYSGLVVTNQLIEGLWLRIAPFMRMISAQFAEESNFDESEDKHVEIIEALRKRNRRRLAHLIEDDILDGVRIQQELMGWKIID